MTITPTMTPKKSATTLLLAGLCGAAIVYAVNLMQQPSMDAGWRHGTQVSTPAPLTAPAQTRGSTSGVAATTDSAETSAPRARN